jgi:phosphoribosylformylglycinamidine (FGAM) synthase PurS component
MVKLSKIKSNPSNPRVIKDEKFEKLVNSIKEFPKMMELRPMVVDENYIVQGGNMRLKALTQLGYKEIPDTWVKKVNDLTDDEKKQFVIKDNIGYGEWDWDILANEWDSQKLEEWGLDIWKQADLVDYSILDENDLSNEIGDMANNVKKAIQIEFESSDYEEAQEVVKYWREQGLYIGKYLIDKLKAEKEKNV